MQRRPELRAKVSARIAVNVGGMCCVMTTGTLRRGAIAEMTFTSACGPPVDEPIAIICGGTIEGLRSFISTGGATTGARTTFVACVRPGLGRATAEILANNSRLKAGPASAEPTDVG